MNRPPHTIARHHQLPRLHTPDSHLKMNVSDAKEGLWSLTRMNFVLAFCDHHSTCKSIPLRTLDYHSILSYWLRMLIQQYFFCMGAVQVSRKLMYGLKVDDLHLQWCSVDSST